MFEKKFNLCLHFYSMFQRQLKMALKIGNVFINEDHLIPVIVKASTEIDTYVKGYHVYKNIWKPNVNEKLETKMEPDNVMDKYAACVKKNISIVGHLPLGKNVELAKMIFYFLRADQYAEWQRSRSWRRRRNVNSLQV